MTNEQVMQQVQKEALDSAKTTMAFIVLTAVLIPGKAPVKGLNHPQGHVLDFCPDPGLWPMPQGCNINTL